MCTYTFQIWCTTRVCTHFKCVVINIYHVYDVYIHTQNMQLDKLPKEGLDSKLRYDLIIQDACAGVKIVL